NAAVPAQLYTYYKSKSDQYARLQVKTGELLTWNDAGSGCNTHGIAILQEFCLDAPNHRAHYKSDGQKVCMVFEMGKQNPQEV
ncbi:hypothetical protein BGZ99_002644, partial [Dissophora globulifera]